LVDRIERRGIFDSAPWRYPITNKGNRIMSFNYFLNGVADLDQKWDALPNNGNMYCVPTAAMNWIYFYAARGISSTPFGTTNPTQIPFNIGRMGNLMDTDAQDGTGFSDAIDGLLDWLSARGPWAVVRSARASDNNNITYKRLRNLLKLGANVMVMRGRYEKDGDEFERIGGHALSVVGLTRTDANLITISVHDPNNGSSNITQAATQVKQEVLTEMRRNIDGDHVTILRWGADSVKPPYLCLDGIIAILPMMGVSNVVANAVTVYRSNFTDSTVATQQFPTPFSGGISELVLDPSGCGLSVIAQNDGQVWTLDLAEGTWVQLANVLGASALAYGSRRERLYVVQDRQVSAFDDTGTLTGKLDMGASVDALSYDQKGDRMIALVGGKRLTSFDSALKLQGQIDAPAVLGSGRLNLSVNSRDQTISIARHGNAEVATLRWRDTNVVNGRFKLLADAAVSGAHVNRQGDIYVSEGGKIATFDKDGVRIANAPFTGLASGPLLKISRSSNAIDPVRSQKKGWKN
jgi:hypothetical protein